MKLPYQQIKELVNLLNNYTISYDKGCPIITDQEWDELYFKLQDLENEYGIIYANSPTHSIQYEVVPQLGKKKHNHPMLSLPKTKDVDELVAFNTEPTFASYKLDGLSCSLCYEDGELVSAETRGDGEIGEDILHNVKMIKNIPLHISYLAPLVIDGEIISTYEDFERFKEEYSTPRNFAAGSIRLLDSKESAGRNLSFIAWSVISEIDDQDSMMSRFNTIKELGFDVVPYVDSSNYTRSDWNLYIQSIQRHPLNYPIDGIVVRYDSVLYGKKLGLTSHHPKHSIAFKFKDDEYESTLQDISWTMGRTGVLTPVAIFDEVKIEGTKVSRANLHNLDIMDGLCPGNWRKGYKVKVFKANQIIPQISEVEAVEEASDMDILDIPAVCPYCSTETMVSISKDNCRNLICVNEFCEGKLINKLDHFLGKKGLDIHGISYSTLEKLLDWGWVNNLYDLFNLRQYRTEWVSKPGFGTKSVDKILDALDAGRITTLDKFIAAIGIPLVGQSMTKEIVKNVDSWKDFRIKIHRRYDWSQINGIAEVKAASINKFDYSEADRVAELLEICVPANDARKEKTLEGMSIVITGKLHNYKNRDELKKVIEEFGGKVVGTISSKTAILINNDANSTSSKNLSAQRLGITIMTEEEFSQKYLTI